MKSIISYITEAIEQNVQDDFFKVKNLKVIYSTNGQTTIEVPTSYSENDMQIYLDDTLLNKLPCSTDNTKEAIGDNYNEISDAYFTYSKFNASNDIPPKIDLKYDIHYDQKAPKDRLYYTLEDLKYIIEFSEFNLKNIDESKIKEEIESIFKSFESNNENKYPIEIKFESVEFNK